VVDGRGEVAVEFEQIELGDPLLARCEEHNGADMESPFIPPLETEVEPRILT
jgi:hypothetical protein